MSEHPTATDEIRAKVQSRMITMTWICTACSAGKGLGCAAAISDHLLPFPPRLCPLFEENTPAWRLVSEETRSLPELTK